MSKQETGVTPSDDLDLRKVREERGIWPPVDAVGTSAEDRGHYAVIQYQFVQFLTDHLADCSRTFHGDLQQMLVLAVIGQVYLESYLQSPPDGQRLRPEGVGGVGTSASRIADVTGIPRETVRRKLIALEQRGWVEKGADSRWRLMVREGVAQARIDLADLDRRGTARFQRIIGALKPLL